MEKTLKLNSFGWDVVRLNFSLDQGPSPYFDHDTEKAVKKFQKDKGLKVDGEVGPMTRKALEPVLHIE